MVNAAIVPDRLPTRRLIDALRRKTAGSVNGGVRIATMGGLGTPFSTRTSRPNGDPPSATLWGEDE